MRLFGLVVVLTLSSFSRRSPPRPSYGPRAPSLDLSLEAILPARLSFAVSTRVYASWVTSRAERFTLR